MLEGDELQTLIDEAVDCWHKVADDHDKKHCNCFREAFVRRLIEIGYKSAYTNE